jgi:hypothetical protein
MFKLDVQTHLSTSIRIPSLLTIRELPSTNIPDSLFRFHLFCVPNTVANTFIAHLHHVWTPHADSYPTEIKFGLGNGSQMGQIVGFLNALYWSVLTYYVAVVCVKFPLLYQYLKHRDQDRPGATSAPVNRPIRLAEPCPWTSLDLQVCMQDSTPCVGPF